MFLRELSIQFFLVTSLIINGLVSHAQSDTLKVRVLNEVIVKSSEISNLKTNPLNISIINTKLFHQTNQNSVDILKQSSGINIRTNGGYGANAEFFINGISGKQIKFFVDGNPIDNLGETQGINIVPIQQTERFEIYKGVIPIELGTDALGGAVNIVTRKENKDFIDFFTAYSSFGTTKNSLQFRKGFGQHFYITTAGSYNHSDNNYIVAAEVPNEFGTVIIKNVVRFHNRFTFSNIKFETGFVKVKWADIFSVQAQYANTRSEIQHNILMRQPYGEALFTDQLKGVTLKYQKSNLLKNIDFNTYFSLNQTQNVFTDTTLNVYNWEGKIVDRRFSGGEISTSGNLLTTYATVFNTRQIISYLPSENLKISFANTYQSFSRRGEDPFAFVFFGNDFFGQPQKMQKIVLGVGVESKWLNGKLINLTSGKYFYSSFSGNKRVDITFTPTSQIIDRLGFNTAFTYFIKPNLFIKTSYENATRLPDESETFGDLQLVRSNLDLKPEKSENLNLNLIYRSDFIDAEVAGFFRKVENIIFLPPATFYGQYQNLLRVGISGVETAVKIRPKPWFSVDANFTYQDLRNKSIIEGYGVNSERYYNARMPNVPYLLANGGFTVFKDSVLNKSSRMQFYWNASYVHNYYLFWSIDGDPSLKNSIPTQFINHVGVSLFHHKSKISLAFDVNNLFDTLIYDNFKVQLPGRVYSLKIRIFNFKK